MSLSCCLAFTAGLSAWPSESQRLLFITSLNLQLPLTAPVLLRHCCFPNKHGKGNNHLGFFSSQWCWRLSSTFLGTGGCHQHPAYPCPQAGRALLVEGPAVQCPRLGWGCPCSLCCAHKSWLGVQELEAIKARVREMEKEDERLKQLQLEAESRLLMSSEAGTAPVPG